MPDRIVRAGILTSDPVNTLSWPAEVLYRRLHSIVDDYGRYDGRSSLLRAHLYPLKIDKVSEADVGKWLTECVTAGLVSLYRVAGRPYVEVTKFGARVRAESSKWPAPADADGVPPASADICPQPRADAAVFVGVVVVDTEAIASAGAEKTKRPAKKCPEGFDPVAPQAWIDEHCPGLDWRRETEKFRDCTFKTARSDWLGTWRNWMRKAFDDRKPGAAMTFRERDAANAAARVHEMTGGLVSAKPTTRRNDALQEVFDATPRLTA